MTVQVRASEEAVDVIHVGRREDHQFFVEEVLLRQLGMACGTADERPVEVSVEDLPDQLAGRAPVRRMRSTSG